jgi:molecular chaperone IbpA
MTQIQFHTFDIPALHRHAIGFDDLFERLNQTFMNSKSDGNYPPHNIIKIDEDHFVLEVAVAGFTEAEVDVEMKNNNVTIKGEKDKKTEIEYLHKGISTRNFVRTFPLGEHIQVRGATVQNGILALALEREVPEEAKPKKIQITFAK